MTKRLLLGVIAIGVLVLVAAVACGTDLQPRVDELEAEGGRLKAQVDQLTVQVGDLTEENGALKVFAGPLPASLDQYFPPQAQGPVYLLEMFALAGPFGGIMGDLQQGDMAGVTANFDAFKEQYQKMSTMVPEWTDMFPMAPVDALGAAVQSGDPAQVGPAMGGVGAACGSCHQLNMVKVQQKYHWPDFHDVEIDNPLTGATGNFVDYMLAIEGTFGAIANDLQQGQLDNARADFQGFSLLFDGLAENGCSACHSSPRTYFVDQSVLDLIDQLGTALDAEAPDPALVGQLSGAIGNESCMKCHLVHLPSALGKERAELFKELFE